MCRKKKKQADIAPRETKILPAGYPSLAEKPDLGLEDYETMRKFLIYDTRRIVARHYYRYGNPYDRAMEEAEEKEEK